ncbi:MAG: alpha-amylase family glycosyl hydrolase [Alkaliphilus sp.]
MHEWLDSIYSDGSKHYISNPNPKLGETVTIKLRVFSGAPVDLIILRRKINGEEHRVYMKQTYKKANFTYYECDIIVNECKINYHFFIITKDQVYYYNQLEVADYIPSEAYDFQLLADHENPSWVKSSVFYQIFPDRFCNGNEKNDVQDGEYYFDGHPTIKMKWGEKPLEYIDGHCLEFYGGDLEGVKEKIPYFKEIGINAIYINPIFYAATNHKYDCLDYFAVDPHFGGDKALQELVEALHENDMKIILDVSINHTGTSHKWFNKEANFFNKEIGAYNNVDSKERDYYFFEEDNSYHAWFNVKTLPTLNYTSEELKKTIYRDENSLVKKWLKAPYHIDGWRFDVANTMARLDDIQLHHNIWPEIRKSIKEVNKEAYIVGEHWSDSSEFLLGNEWDSAMNYFGFGRPIRHFVGEQDLYLDRVPELKKIKYRLSAKNLGKRVMQHIARLSHQILECQYNLFDSHDVPRLHNNEEIDFDSYRGAVIMLYTFPGTPSIYYGDEIGVDGHIKTVEGCRYPMVWDRKKYKKEYFELYKILGHLKLENEVLHTGGFKILYNKSYIFSFARFTEDKAIVSVCSMEDEKQTITIPLNLIGKIKTNSITEVFGEEINIEVENEKLVLTIPAKKSYLFKIAFDNH